MEQQFRIIVLLTILALSSCGAAFRTTKSQSLLDRRITMDVHPSEILESVVNRLNGIFGGNVIWDSRMLAPYMANAVSYKNMTIR